VAKLEDLMAMLLVSLLVQLMEFSKEYLIKLQSVMLMALLRVQTEYLMDEYRVRPKEFLMVSQMELLMANRMELRMESQKELLMEFPMEYPKLMESLLVQRMEYRQVHSTEP